MKRKFVCGTVALCLALSVAGCGKNSEERQAANYYQNELGLDKDEAEELAHYLYGEAEEEEEPSVSEEAPQETVVEPLPELLDSEWYDRKVQLLDMVFTLDEYLTEEVIREIVEGSVYDVEIEEDFDENGYVCLKGINLADGQCIVYLGDKRTLPSTYVSAGFFENGDDYYTFARGFVRIEDNYYDKGIMEVEALDFKTRDDVLAYLADNSFVEVEEKQALYEHTYYDLSTHVNSVDAGDAEVADVPHYYCKGAQSITFYRVHRLSEIEQEIEYNYKHYSGCHLNLYQRVIINFNTDGTISSIEPSEVRMPVLIRGEKK